VIVVVSVAELFPGVGSVAPPGNTTVAVFDNVPVAVAATVPDTTNVTDPPAATVTDAPMFPEPLAGHDEPADAEHVHDTPVNDPGIVSVTVAPAIVDGPAFDATTVYDTPVPASTDDNPSVFEIDRSATPVNTSVSVA
jgi:hypothetical protein